MEDVSVEKHDCAQGLLVGRGAGVTLRDQSVEKLAELPFAARARISAVMAHVAPDPTVVGLARSRAVVARGERAFHELAERKRVHSIPNRPGASGVA